MKAAALDALQPEDVTAIVTKQVEKAKKGDAGAAKFVLGFITAAAGKPAQMSAAPIRLEEADPPKPVAIASVPVEQMRKLAALYLVQHTFANVMELGRLLALEGDALAAVLNCDWFTGPSGGRVQLTPAGRNAIG